jgi:putative drug exporter of the RND superfamily
MFEKLGRFVIRFRFAFLVFWIALAAICYLFAPSLAEVGTSDETSFLPDQSESQEVSAVLGEAFPGDSSPGRATVVFSRPDGLTEADREYIAGLPALIFSPGVPEVLTSAITEVVTAEAHPELADWLTSKDGVAEIVNVNLSIGGFEETAGDAVHALRDLLAGTMPAGLQGHVTGQAGIGADYLDAAMEATDRTTVVTVILVVVILLIIYRAPLAALAPLLTIGIAWVVGRGVLGWLAQAGWQVTSVLDTFMVVLVFGVGTDYSIFLISRVREELAHDEWAGATRRAVGRIGGVITASAATVIVGLSSMAVARFGMVRSVGPALAVAIAVTVLAGLTLTPAYLGLFGRFLFWPFHHVRAHDGKRGPWAALARGITRRPGLVTVVLVVALILPAMAMPSLRADFNQLGELPASSDGRQGYAVVDEHFEPGQLAPVTVLVEAPALDLTSSASLARLRATQDLLASLEGVGSVSSVVAPSGDGSTPDGFRPSLQLADMAEQLVPQEGDLVEALRSLLEEDTEAGLSQAAAYIEGLGKANPGLADLPAYQGALADLQSTEMAVGLLRSSLRVSAELGYVTAQVEAADAAEAAGQLPMLQAYLGELAAAYPEVEGSAGFRDAQAALGAAAEFGANPQLTARLVTALESLAAGFADRPDAYLVSTLVASSGQGDALQPMLQEPMARLPGELTSLADEFATRPDYYLPVGLASEGEVDDVALVMASFVSADASVAQFRVILDLDPYSNEAIALIPKIRQALAAQASGYGEGARLLAGGTTAAYSDIEQTIGEDFWRVAAITVAGILLVLILLLRSLVAPLYLVATVLLSWMSALGIAALLFQDLLGHSGVSYFLSLIVFVLLVALGSDYNIFLMSRVREESQRRGVRDGIQVASAHTGTVITSAGIILAGTFGAMAIAPLRLLFQIGVTVALGVLIDTFIVRSMLVPAITALLGKWAWWPFHKRTPEPAAEAAAIDGGQG